MEFNAFQSIDNFHTVRKEINKRVYLAPGPIKYRAKQKLHGSNGGIRITKDSVIPQKRTSDVTILQDNMGFAFFVEKNKQLWQDCWNGTDFIVYGEWFGPGVQRGVACSLITEKSFAIFEIQIGLANSEDSTVIVDPDEIEKFLNYKVELIPNVYVLPWETNEIVLNFHNDESCQNFADIINEMVKVTETEDGWIKRQFGIVGPGEGFVLWPIGINKRCEISPLVFKAKNETHSVVKSRAPVTIDAEKVSGAAAFAEMVVTEPRLQQAFQEACGGVAETKNTGAFLQWINRDVLKECMAELSASGFEWKTVAGAVTGAARRWFLIKCAEIN